MDQHRKYARVTGRVQGVGFRYFTHDAALDLGLTGWVRNLPDGSVELEAQGPPEVVAAFLTRVEQGPPLGRVDDLVLAERSPVTGERDFRIRH